MSRALPLGTYVGGTGPLHALDARVKLAVLLMATILAFARPSMLVMAGIVALLACGMALAGVSAATLARAARPCAVILVFVIVADTLRFDGTGDVTLIHGLGLSLLGLGNGAFAVVRVLVLLGLALVVSTTTTTTELADACGWALSPLGRLGLPAADIAMVLSIALRFIPICVDEFDRVVCAQRARGMDFSEGGLRGRLSAWGGVLTPVVVSLFGHADRLAGAMQDRLYAGKGRTSMAEAPKAADWVVLACGAAAFVAALVWG